MNKDEVTSHTIHLESSILSMIINKYEHKDVVTTDVAGVFLISDIDSCIAIKLDGNIVDIMCEANNNTLST